MRVAFRRRGEMVWRQRIAVAWVLVVATGVAVIVRDSLAIDDYVELVAAERGASLCRLVERTRDWNAKHGGVYVHTTAPAPPEARSKPPPGEIGTPDIQAWTLISPVGMIRQIAEAAEADSDLGVRITSLRPLRPENAADAWETEALQAFEAGEPARLALVPAGPAGKPVHRYMVPLRLRPDCMGCHNASEDRVGDVRGGVSVTMAAGALLGMASIELVWSTVLHTLAFGVLGVLLHWLLRVQQRHVGGLEALNLRQGESLEVQGRALVQANTALAAEVERRRLHEENLAAAERRYRALVEASPDGMAMTDGTRILLANHRLAELLDARPETLLGRPILDLVHPGDRSRLPAAGGESTPAPASGPVATHVRLVAQGGRSTYTEVRVSAGLPVADATPAVMFTFRDVSERVQAELDRSVSRAYFENAAHGILVTDARNRIIRVNPAFTRLTGYTLQEVVGATPQVLQSGRHDRAFYERMWASLLETDHWEGEIWNRRRDGGVYAEWLSITVIRDPSGQIVNHVATFQDITTRKTAEEKVRHRATHDALTDLPNRALFGELAENALAAATRYGRRCALLCIDLDRFKQVNDTFGHAAGDEVLRETARRLAACVRDADVVARVGGDELNVLLPQVADDAGVEQIAARICAAVALPFSLPGGEAHIGASVGVVLAPDHGVDVHLLLSRADRAMYAAKSAGRGTWRFYTPEMAGGQPPERAA